jgi:soluble lytic murein transglycosylase
MSLAVLRKPLLWIVLALAATAAAGYWWVTRPARWDDALHPPPPLAEAIEKLAAGDVSGGIERIERSLREYRMPSWEPRMRFLAATHLSASGQAQRALTLLADELPADAPLAPFSDHLRARCLLQLRRHGEAARSAARAAGVAGYPAREEALRVQASALEAEQHVREALFALDAARIPALTFEAAKIAERAGVREGARRWLASLVLDGPPGDEAERAAEALRSSYPDLGSRFLHAERARLLPAIRKWVDAGRLQQALDLLRATRRDPSPEEVIVEADLQLRLGRPISEPLLAKALRAGGESGDGARYFSARARQARGQFSQYRAGLEALARRPGRTRFRLRALLDLAQLAEGKPSVEALTAYRRYREVAGDDAGDPLAFWREAWIAYELGRDSDAERGFARVLARKDAPDSVRMAALYWSGRRLEAHGRNEAAKQSYREAVSHLNNHYYGMLAAGRLRIAMPKLPERPESPDPSSLKEPTRRWLTAARELRSIGLFDLALATYRTAASDAAAHRIPIALEGADAALDAKAAADSVQLVQIAVGDRDAVPPEALARRHWQLLLPAPSGPDLAAAARAVRLDPWLVASVVLEESAFNPLAVSRVGARGLLQVMPATGEELARRMGVRNFRSDRLFEPALNLRLGCVYLRDQVDRLGSLPVALAAYNAGGTRAARWSLPTDSRDPERYVERIPVPETRSYVKRILANVRLYQIAWPEGFESSSP